jgi:hypothetical protein
MDPQVLGQFGDSKYLLVRRHSFIFLSPPGQKLMCWFCVSANSWFSLLAPMSSNLRELFSSSSARFTPAHAFELS